MSALKTRQPPTDTGACGSYRGHRRHRRKDENDCTPCADARRAYDKARRSGPAKPPPAQADDMPPRKAEILTSEIEFLLMCGEGEHAIARALGYTNPGSLKDRLRRHKRTDLTRRIFAYHAEIEDLKAHSGTYNKITRTR